MKMCVPPPDTQDWYVVVKEKLEGSDQATQHCIEFNAGGQVVGYPTLLVSFLLVFAFGPLWLLDCVVVAVAGAVDVMDGEREQRSEVGAGFLDWGQLPPFLYVGSAYRNLS